MISSPLLALQLQIPFNLTRIVSVEFLGLSRFLSVNG